MTREEIIAATLWRTQATDAGCPESVAAGRTPEAFAESSELVRRPFLKYAAAVLDICGPKPLVWENSGTVWFAIFGPGSDAAYRHINGGVVMTIRSPGRRPKQTIYPNAEAAQSAVQAHADAAHWAGTKLGDVE